MRNHAGCLHNSERLGGVSGATPRYGLDELCAHTVSSCRQQRHLSAATLPGMAEIGKAMAAVLGQTDLGFSQERCSSAAVTGGLGCGPDV